MEEIYKEYSKVVYKYLLAITNDVDLAEELMQETFESAVKNINKFRQECSVKNWLCTIAKNKWIDFYKKKKRLNEINIDETNEKDFMLKSIEEEYIDKVEIINIYKKIHKLDEKTKEVIYLRIKSDFSFKEIGDVMGRSEEWARTTFYRGKIKLKEELENER